MHTKFVFVIHLRERKVRNVIAKFSDFRLFTSHCFLFFFQTLPGPCGHWQVYLQPNAIQLYFLCPQPSKGLFDVRL